MTDSETKTCPACAEEIKAAALRCKHCGENLAPVVAAPAVPLHKMDLAPMMVPALVTACGIVLFGYATIMDVTVALPPASAEFLGKDRVVNIHLLAQQANYRYAGGFLALLGVGLAAWKHTRQTATGVVAVQVPEAPEARQKRILVLVGIASFLLLLALAKTV